VAATPFGITVAQPQRSGYASRVRARRADDAFTIETTNVRRLRVDGAPKSLSIDGAAVAPAKDGWYVRAGDAWKAGAPDPAEKSPARSGPFKRAFDRQFVFVYGEGDHEGLVRARHDAQVWWVRGNGDVPVIADTAFSPREHAGRNVILYGNAASNRAFARVLARCPITVGGDKIVAGGKEYEGLGFGCVFVHPRSDDPDALVGVFGYTGPLGARLGYALLPFVSGVGYPDYAVFDAAILSDGDAGVRAAGWFDHAWALE
jgi:hypothetical protein